MSTRPLAVVGPNTAQKRRVHLLLQGKGGVGKSVVASLIAQHYLSQGKTCVFVDTDPVNATFAGFKAFDVRKLALQEPGTVRVNPRNFDQLMEWIMESDRESDFVVDNGASCFLPLCEYIVASKVVELLESSGTLLTVHTVITGGAALLDTLQGFNSLATTLSSLAEIYVWQNEYFGDIAKDGKSFEMMQVYLQHKGRINGMLRIPRQDPDTFGKDLELMLNNKLTFDEAQKSSDLRLMAKQRLTQIQRVLFEQMKTVLPG